MTTTVQCGLCGRTCEPKTIHEAVGGSTIPPAYDIGISDEHGNTCWICNVCVMAMRDASEKKEKDA